MTRLIGGLLVVSLLYAPAMFQVKYVAYGFVKDNGQIVVPTQKSNASIADAAVCDIDYAFDELVEGERRIKALINDKNMLLKKIEAELDLRSHLRVTLSENQIEGFNKLMECCNSETDSIQICLDKIDEAKGRSRIDADNVHRDGVSLLLAEIDTVSSYQNKVIDSVMRIIDSANNMLSLL